MRARDPAVAVSLTHRTRQASALHPRLVPNPSPVNLQHSAHSQLLAVDLVRVVVDQKERSVLTKLVSSQELPAARLVLRLDRHLAQLVAHSVQVVLRVASAAVASVQRLPHQRQVASELLPRPVPQARLCSAVLRPQLLLLVALVLALRSLARLNRPRQASALEVSFVVVLEDKAWS